jgi:hypothetical protein
MVFVIARGRDSKTMTLLMIDDFAIVSFYSILDGTTDVTILLQNSASRRKINSITIDGVTNEGRHLVN